MAATVFDVDPLQWGTSWAAPASRLFAALSRRDPATGRARGWLRLRRISPETGNPAGPDL